MIDKAPFLEKEYTKCKELNRCCPFLEIKIGSNKKSVIALADTGCTVGLKINLNQTSDLDLGEKISDDPHKFLVADGHKVEAEIYKSLIHIDGEEREIEIWVVNPQKIVGYEDKDGIILLGRGLMDNFDVMFKGKDGKIALYKPK